MHRRGSFPPNSIFPIYFLFIVAITASLLNLGQVLHLKQILFGLLCNQPLSAWKSLRNISALRLIILLYWVVFIIPLRRLEEAWCLLTESVGFVHCEAAFLLWLCVRIVFIRGVRLDCFSLHRDWSGLEWLGHLFHRCYDFIINKTLATLSTLRLAWGRHFCVRSHYIRRHSLYFFAMNFCRAIYHSNAVRLLLHLW